jgi:hypothetical protein
MRSSQVVKASGCQCNNPSIFRHKGICVEADEEVLNNVYKKPNPEINKEIKQLNNYGLTTLVFAQENLHWSHVMHT